MYSMTKEPKTQEELIKRLGKVAVHLAQAASILSSTGHKHCDAHIKALEAYRSVMATKKWHEDNVSAQAELDAKTNERQVSDNG